MREEELFTAFRVFYFNKSFTIIITQRKRIKCNSASLNVYNLHLFFKVRHVNATQMQLSQWKNNGPRRNVPSLLAGLRVFEGGALARIFFSAHLRPEYRMLRITAAVFGKNSPNRSRVKYHEPRPDGEGQVAAKWPQQQHQVAVPHSRSIFLLRYRVRRNVLCTHSFRMREQFHSNNVED